MGKELYLEIGTEEIPAGYILPALQAMAGDITRFLDDHRIARGEPFTTGTPRRLVVVVPGVAERQEAFTTEIIGPSRQVAFDDAGRPTKAALGFAKSHGLAVEALQLRQTPKGAYVCILREEQGVATKELLERMLSDFIARIPFPKSMRWMSQSETFARPIHWVVALLGGEVLDAAYGNIRTGSQSFGHRFMSPQWVTVKDYASHRENLRKHFVIVDFEERKNLIRDGVAAAARGVGGRILEDEELLEEVANLVEHPRPILGRYEEKYLKLPPELLITVMREHQRYFAVVNDDSRLLPYFVTAANTIPRDPEVVAAGNARVLRARLEDARFYYEEDQKVRLEERAEELKRVVFHSKLGTSWAKIERFTAIARWLGERVSPTDLDALLRAATLCKADLVTGMVSEFPELQGIVGRDLARLQGEAEEVARAIFEHYLPTRAGGPIPQGMAGALLSIADKLDTIVGCFGVGLLPTGTADPFALRRQTLGIIRIVVEKQLRVSLGELIDEALPLLAGHMTEPAETVKQGVMEFFRSRLLHLLVSQEGFGSDVVEAALAPGIDDLVEAVDRTRALAKFHGRPDFESLAGAFKRVVNIIKEEETAPVSPGLFQHDAERQLYGALQQAGDAVETCLARSDHDGALSAMAHLRGAIDAFFDSVLVMDADAAIRGNRLALLTRVRDLFARVADFRKIQTAA
jgi:glycyl-tRNA synthetase beta chain